MRRTASLPIFIRGEGTLQQQIYRCIRQSIVDGLVDADSPLPSTRVLAADLRVSRTTTLLALEQLRAEGFIVAKPGSGTFVARQLPEHPLTSVVPTTSAVARPAFSQRGNQLARVPTPDRRRSAVPPCAFRLGTPALDLFPWRLWAQITRECLRALRPTQLDYSSLAGLHPLREAIAEQMQSRGTRCDASRCT